MSSSILDKKVDYWEHQLLDLGKRNKMINYRETKRATLKISEPSISILFQRLAVKEEKLTFKKAIDKDTDIRVFSILSLLENLSAPLTVTTGDIGTESSVQETLKTLKHLRSKSRLALEEQGTNILYLSFGFIEWKDGKGASAKWIKSPLVLVPVVLSLDSLNSPYTLEKHEDDIVVNPTLDYYLNTEYGIDLPEFDEGKESLDEFLLKMEEIADVRGWKILREVNLGLLSFLKITMYHDLLNNEERIRNHPVIRAMAGETDEVNQIPEGLNNFDLDSIGVQDCFQVMSADSSQQDAVLYSKNNVSFVMQGPPGTGKSQTITNIISEALADGKKVLFVSEKMAALQVVYRRLQEAHLGEFCLPLHSYKANKKEILEQIGANLKLKQTRVKDTAKSSLDDLQSIRNEINAYAKELHQIIEPLNISCYEVYGKLDDVSDAPSIPFTLDDVTALSQTDINKLLGLIKTYFLAVSGLGYNIKDNPWDGVVVRAFGYDEKEQLARCLDDAIVLSERCSEQLASLQECSDMVSVLNCHQLTFFCDDLLSVAALPRIPDVWLSYENTNVILTKAVTASESYGNMKSLRKQIAAVFCDDVFSFDYNVWKTGVSELFSQIENTRFLTQHNHGSIYENAETLSSQVQALSDEVSAFERNIGDIESLLDTKLPHSKTGIDFANGLSAIIKDNQLLPKEWLLSDIDTVRQTALTAKALAHEIKTSEQTLLMSWEIGILTYDYLPVLQRFKTDYTGRFKTSNQQYCADKKSIHALSSTVIKELTDDDILDVLNQLKQYHKKLDLFSKDTPEYVKSLGNHFTGLDSDWDSIIETVKQTALSAKALAYEIKTTEQTLLQSWEKEILTYDYLPVLQRFKTDYTGWLKIFNQQYRRDKKSIQALSSKVIKKLTDEAALDILNQLKQYHEKLDLFNNNASEYVKVLGNHFTGLNSDWESIIDTVKQITITAKAQAHEIKSLEQALLQSWEKEILTYDYLPVLSRYKTDYTGLFKVLFQQHRTDKKSIQAFSINAIKELTNDDVLEILNQLKLYHENLDLFNNNVSEYEKVLGDHFTGLDSDWDNILQLADVCASVQQQFKGQVSEKTADALSCDHQEFNNTVSSLANKASTALSNAQNIAAKNPFKPDLSASESNTEGINSTAAVLTPLLDKVSSQKSRIKACLIQPDTSYETISQGIDKLNAYIEVSNIIESAEPEYAKLFDYLFQNEDTDWKSIISLDKQYRKSWLLRYYSYVRPLINISESRNGEVTQTANNMKSDAEQLQKYLEWLDKRFADSAKLNKLSILELLNKLKDCKNNFDWLEKWIDYQEAKSDCRKNGLENYIEAIETADTFENIEASFLKGFYQMWLGEAYAHLPSVRKFRKNVQDERVAEFARLDDYQLRVAQMRIRERLIENLPKGNHLLKATDEVAILKRELNKKRRIMPLRKLFRQIPNLLLKLKPCLMMSPLSVSYFLETEAYTFDLVIFDEASQIFPEDAIGAIFRGTQVIIAGDSKQLPPTNFFAATTNNLDSDYDMDDEDASFADSISDSILEETAAALPNRTLLWHYRSKHESLISFSNSEIYKNELITFPNSTSTAPDMGVEYVYVPNGYYEGKPKNCNVAEAQKCVELVAEHIRRNPNRSLGIIAFSEKQQNAIENAILDFREKHPIYETFFDESKEEPFFVKNLENVQGDERDTIIFSIGYAKDRSGKMYMRFGPLSNSGGERRLNVAITRAKCNVKLVGSILPSDIDLNRAKSDGVRMLRAYIEFAHSNFTSASADNSYDEFIDTDRFCDEVAEFLTEQGYKIQRHVGCSDYKIDIAVVDSNNEDAFIAGIECDGLSYIQAKTARDRDHLRRKVLENMGWNMYRVWSTEWSKYPQQEKNALIAFIDSLSDQKHTLKTSNDSDDTNIEDIADEQTQKETAPSENPYGFKYYEESKWWETEYTNRFNNDARIADTILHIVREEQPIHLELLYKRLGSSFTAGKATNAVKRSIDLIIERDLKGRVQIENQFVRTLPLEPIVVRIPKPYYTPRPMEYIYDEEVALAMVEIVRKSFGLSPKDLAAECARVFGFERRGAKIKAKTQAAFSLLIDKGYAKIIDGKVYLTGGN